MRHVGIDGCRAGWIAVSRGPQGLTYRIDSDLAGLIGHFSDAERIFIDVPIGLPWAEAPVRPCDAAARRALGAPRCSSVFPTPCREALAAADYVTASQKNFECLGWKLSKQTWGILPKIAEADRLLRETRSGALREVHPEVCFWALAGEQPMRYSKRTPQGRRERLEVLLRYEPGVAALRLDALRNTRRTDVKEDDLLDAAVVFLTAEAKDGTLAVLAGRPAQDTEGLPIEMVYLRTGAKSPTATITASSHPGTRTPGQRR